RVLGLSFRSAQADGAFAPGLIVVTPPPVSNWAGAMSGNARSATRIRFLIAIVFSDHHRFARRFHYCGGLLLRCSHSTAASAASPSTAPAAHPVSQSAGG